MKIMYLIEHYAINRKNGVWSLTSYCDVLGITGTVQFICALIFILGPALELTINVERNALAVVDRIFPRFSHAVCRFSVSASGAVCFTHKPLIIGR